MHLRLVAGEPGQRGFMAGYASRLYLDGVEVSQYVKEVTILNNAEEPIQATVKFYLTGLEVDLLAVITPLIDEAEQSGTLGEVIAKHKAPRPNPPEPGLQ